MKAEPHLIREIEKLFERYENEVNKADYRDKTKETYSRYGGMFVRWCKDEFELRGFKDEPSHHG